MTNCENRKIVVRVDLNLESLMPQYLKHRREDIQNITSALASGDYPAIEGMGHNMKGSGGGYGFDAISRIGRKIELSAVKKNADAIRKSAADLADYLNRIEIIYV